MMRNWMYGLHFVLFALCAMVGVNCATSGSTRKDTGAEREQFPRVTFRQEANLLGATVRQLGEQCGGGLVLVNGLEGRAMGPLSLRESEYEFLVRQLASEAGLAYLATPYYFLLYPAEYKALENISVAAGLPQRFQDIRTTCSFGSGTTLFNVLGVLGTNLGLTLVADNVVAETRCGELFLTDAPLPNVLDAILQSARLSPDAFLVESTDEYVFICSRANQNTSSTLLNADALTAEEQQLLARQVNLCLPERPESAAQVVVYHAATPLEDVLPALAEQLECPVRAEAGLDDLPVNFTVMNNVRIGTALDLLIRQWPIAQFGYEVAGGDVVIRRR